MHYANFHKYSHLRFDLQKKVLSDRVLQMSAWNRDALVPSTLHGDGEFRVLVVLEGFCSAADNIQDFIADGDERYAIDQAGKMADKISVDWINEQNATEALYHLSRLFVFNTYGHQRDGTYAFPDALNEAIETVLAASDQPYPVTMFGE